MVCWRVYRVRVYPLVDMITFGQKTLYPAISTMFHDFDQAFQPIVRGRDVILSRGDPLVCSGRVAQMVELPCGWMLVVSL